MDKITSIEHKIIWDNSYIGEIDSLVSEDFIEKKFIHITLKYDINKTEKAILHNFESFIPLICEEFKSLFNLKQTGKHIVKYKNKHMLMVNHKMQINFKDYLKYNNITPKYLPDYIKNDIQKFIAFRYIHCLKTNNESCFGIIFDSVKDSLFAPYVINSFENEINYNVKITQRIIDNWFDNIEHFHLTIKKMINDRDVTLLKFKIKNIIEKYDKSLIGWSNVIYNRLLLESDIF